MSTLFPYTTLFRSGWRTSAGRGAPSTCIPPATPVTLSTPASSAPTSRTSSRRTATPTTRSTPARRLRSEEHTSELQSHSDLVCRLLLEKKKEKKSRKLPISAATTPSIHRSGAEGTIKENFAEGDTSRSKQNLPERYQHACMPSDGDDR